MHGLILAASLLLGLPGATEPDAAALVADLGGPRFAQRQAAEQALGRLGRGALPALRAAAADPDPEIRARAAGIVHRIELGLLTEPTMVRLDFADTPLAEALSTINRREGLRLGLAPEIPALWGRRRLSLRASEPLPFWKAIDAICAAGRLHTVFGGQAEFDQADAGLALYDGFATSQGRFDDRGPFRIQLASLHYQSEVHLTTEVPDEAIPGDLPVGTGPGRPMALPSKQFFLQLLVGAEPRLAIAPGGSTRVTEAIDDRGRSLLGPTRAEPVLHESGYLGVSPSPLVHLRVDLAYPEPPAVRIKRIRGAIPLLVSTRRPDPLVISLGDAPGKMFRRDQVAVTVEEVHAGLDQLTTIDLVVKATGRSAGGANVESTEGDEVRSIASPQQLEVLDAAGRIIQWFPTSSIFNGEEAKLSLTLLDRGGVPAVPATIRYHGLIRDRTEVAFEFRDIPMP